MSVPAAAIFKEALHLDDPWNIIELKFSPELKRLDIRVAFPKGNTFACPDCGHLQSTYRTNDRVWKHLGFFEHETYLHAKQPQLKCPHCEKTRYVEVPWARPGSGFTLLFEALTMELAPVIPLTVVAGLLGTYSSRLMRIITFYVNQARTVVDMSQVKNIGVDETSRKKGHEYITTVIDLDDKKVVFATEGKDHTTLERFKTDLIFHNGQPNQIKSACINLSRAFIKGMADNFPEAVITYDHFHVMQLVNQAVDQVRREEVIYYPSLKNSRFAWLKNPNDLTKKQQTTVEALSKRHLKTSRAYQMKLNLQSIYVIEDRTEAEKLLKRWYFWVTHCRIKPMIDLVKTIKRHWQGILNYFINKLTNGLCEGINSIIQGLKRRARGYTNTDNLITMVYLLKGKLNFNLPTVSQLTCYR